MQGPSKSDLSGGAVTEKGRFQVRLESPIFSAPAIIVIVAGFFIPMGVMVVYSFWPTIDQQIVHSATLSNYTRILSDSTYWATLLHTFLFIGLASAITLAAAFPFAYFVAQKVKPQRRMLWVIIGVLPFFTSYLIRVFAWTNLLGDHGVINGVLSSIGFTDSPLAIFGANRSGIVITFVYLLFPLAFLTIYITIERMNATLLEAAADLGASPMQRLQLVTLPIARTGLIGAFIFCFVSMFGDYITPLLIGGTQGYMYSNLIANQFGSSQQWGFGSALALVFAMAVFALLIVTRTVSNGPADAGGYTRNFTPGRSPFLRGYAVAIIAFLYGPMIILVLFALNDSPSIGLPFEGFTLRWFQEMLNDPMLGESFSTSITIALAAVGVSTVLGTLAAFQLSRVRGRWKAASLGIIAVPIFVPPLMLGLAIIIGMNALSIDRGLWTIILGHVLLTLPVVTLLVTIRLEGVDPNLELAAIDLGASPVTAMLRVSVPQALPAIVAAMLISFAMSMDDFIMTYLITGSDSTLPLYIFGQLRFAVTPDIAAISALMLIGTLLLVLIGASVASAGNRRRGIIPVVGNSAVDHS